MVGIPKLSNAVGPEPRGSVPETHRDNLAVIEEFRANAGKVGGRFDGVPLLLLTTTGARSGEPHTTPLRFLAYGDRMIVFAADAGSPTHPDWYHNLVARPMATVEVRHKAFEATATIQTGDERDRLLALQVEQLPELADHQARTTRQIAVVSLRVAGQKPR